jgi:hypothetical protein
MGLLFRDLQNDTSRLFWRSVITVHWKHARDTHEAKVCAVLRCHPSGEAINEVA